MKLRGVLVLVLGVAPLALAASCTTKSPAPTYKSREELLDPQACSGCHQQHYVDWSGSMHAYASDDPVFQAMNKRGQRETDGGLGNFCVNCHAPMAVREGATTDGLNVASLPSKLKGVTCYFCHTVDSVQGTHNDPLHLGGDVTMRGELKDPVANGAHPSTYSPLVDHNQGDSAALCGTCHDIVTTQNAAIERTFQEWQGSAYATQAGNTCGQCHMLRSQTMVPIAENPDGPLRIYHSHLLPGADVGLTPNLTQADAQAQGVQDRLDNTFQGALCVVQQDGFGAIRVILDNVGAGHNVPSGSAQDRRLWAEVIAYKGGTAFYKSGVVPDGTPVTTVMNDPDLWLIRDCMLDGTGKHVDMFWQAAGYESNLFPVQATFDPMDPRYYQTHIVQYYPRDPSAVLPAAPDQVTLRVRLQPMGLDVLQDLVKSGDLDPSIPGAMPTFDINFGTQATLTWTSAAAMGPPSYIEPETHHPVACVSTPNFNLVADKVPATNHTKCQP
jgi:hypothetical protein